MNAYELGRLNDKEFEVLAAQLVQEVTGNKVERFKPGKDKGVDGRFFMVGGGECILQAKHWEKSGLSALISYLEKVEVLKIQKLKPSRYIFLTSVPLSRVNKQAIMALFSPYILSEADVWGNEDIQDALRDKPKVAEHNYKLWLASADVLRMIFSAPIVGRSSFKIDEVASFLPKYVVTRCHHEALKRLESVGSIIVIGEPGIGKSTLAEQLVLHYVLGGYELCFIENALEEAEAVWAPEKKQIFYFDDFLGRNYLEVIDKNHDSHVLGFMRRIKKDKLKKFVLTSRTTIMQQGKSISELFRAYNIDQQEYEVRISDYTPLEKAHILYNHLWFGSLALGFVEKLYVDKRYMTVVSHRNFNPRLIAFITDTHKIAGVSEDSYWHYIEETLKNPKDIWRGVFENQLDEVGRLIVCLVVFHGAEISEQLLRAACELARRNREPVVSPAEWALAFERSYQMSVGAVITRLVPRFGGGVVKIGLFNPSVGDYILSRFSADIASVESFVSLLRDESALTHLRALRKSGIVNESDFRALLKLLLSKFWSSLVEAPNFSALLTSYILRDEALVPDFLKQLSALGVRFFELANLCGDQGVLCRFARFVLESKTISDSDGRWLAFAQHVISDSEAPGAFVELSEAVVLLDESMVEVVVPALSHRVIEFWKDTIGDAVVENDIARDYVDVDNEYSKAESAIVDFVRDSLGEYAISFSAHEVNDIVSSFDIYDYMSDNQQSYLGSDGAGRPVGQSNYGGSAEEQIDDLFDRS